MRKILLLTAIACFGLLGAQAQLTNTKWKGVIKLPSEDGVFHPIGVIWDFRSDTSKVTYENGMETDVMVYHASDSTVTFRKVSGGVPCDTVAVATCVYKVTGGKLFLTMIQDPCVARAHADIAQPFQRVE